MGAVRIDGFVMETTDYEDFDKIVKVFSMQFGKTSFIALGVNRPASKNKYSLQTFSLSEFEIFKARKKDKVSKLKTGVLVNDFFEITKNYNSYIYSSIIFKILDKIGQINNNHYKIFKMVKTVLENMNEKRKPFLNYLMFLIYTIQDSIQPWRISRCVRCNKNKYPLVRFEYSESGLICKRCLWPGETMHPESFIQMLIDIGTKSFNKCIEQKFNNVDLIVLHNIVVNYFENTLGFYLGPISMLKNTAALNVDEKVAEKYK